ncbi:glycosyltransferase family 39 protein [uncultured Aquimarina sp.]|uniref:ArnT family glycosyltransferase n=1 Tax=uncultured Aquimarina sp. TaxID=575652 RepID=UPI002629D073|nr:glycosyltransferase family 39 protein [uncultured Aquimarina sp.]
MKISNKSFILGLIGIHLLFFIIKIWIGDYFIIDSFEYYKLSENILYEFEFYCGDLNSNIDLRNYNRRPPLYSIFILISSLFLKFNIGILLFQNVLSVISLILIRKIFEEHSFKINTALYFLFIGTSLNQFIYSNLIMSEIFFQFMIIILFYSLHRLIQNPSWKKLIIFQLFIALGFLIKPVFYLFIIPNIVLTYLIYKKTKIRWGFLSSIIPISIFVLYSFWNYTRTGSTDFSSMQNFNLLEWNVKYFHQNKYGAQKAIAINDSILSKSKEIKSYPERQNYIKNTSIGYIKEDLLGYGLFHLKGCFRIFIDPGRFDIANFFKIESENSELGILHHLNNSGLKGAFNFLKSQNIFLFISFFIILFFNLIKAVGFIWFWIKNYKKANLTILIILSVVLYIVILTGPLGASRFFVPILPAYLLFAVLGCNDIVLIIHRKKLE